MRALRRLRRDIKQESEPQEFTSQFTMHIVRIYDMVGMGYQCQGM